MKVYDDGVRMSVLLCWQVIKHMQENFDNSKAVWELLGSRLEEGAIHDARVAYNKIKDDETAVATITSSTHVLLGELISRKLPHISCTLVLLQPLCPSTQ